MTQREVTALQDEVLALRKQLSALAILVAELATHRPTPYMTYQPYVPYPVWPPTVFPLVTYTSGYSSGSTTTTTLTNSQPPFTQGMTVVAPTLRETL